MLVWGASTWPKSGAKKPTAAASRIRAGKTVTAMRAERSSEVGAPEVGASGAGAGREEVMRGIVLHYEMASHDVDAWWARCGTDRPVPAPDSAAAQAGGDRPGVDRLSAVHGGAVQARHLRQRLGAVRAAQLERGDGVDLPASAVASGAGALGEDAAVVRGDVRIRPELPQTLHGLRDQLLEQHVGHPQPARLGPAHPRLQAPASALRDGLVGLL